MPKFKLIIMLIKKTENKLLLKLCIAHLPCRYTQMCYYFTRIIHSKIAYRNKLCYAISV